MGFIPNSGVNRTSGVLDKNEALFFKLIIVWKTLAALRMLESWFEHKHKIRLMHKLECSVNREAAMCGQRKVVTKEE